MFDEGILQNLVVNLIDGVVVISEQGEILNVNPSVSKLFGYEVSELIGQNVNILMPEPYRSNHNKYLQRYLKTGEKKILNASRELIGRRRNGSLFPIFLHVNEAEIDGQRVFVGVIHDISGRKLAETAYKETYNKLQAILDTAVEGMIIIDQRGRIDMANPAALRLFGYTEKEVMGKNVSMLMNEPEKTEHDQYLKNYQETGKKKIIGIGRDVFGRKKDGTPFPLRLSVSEVKLRKTTIYVGLLHDLTAEHESQQKLERYADELKQMNAELENKVKIRTSELQRMNQNLKNINSKLEKEIERRSEAEKSALKALEKEKELNEMKSRFVSMASHEFRTPLSGILTSVSLLNRYEGEEFQEKRKKHLTTIRSSVHNLTSILNDFLSLDKLEEGRVDVNLTEFALAPMVQEFVSEIEQTCKPGQKIKTNFAAEIDHVYADRHLLKNILINLTSNAIKYSSEGQEIEIGFKMDGDSLVITVGDRGIGIPKASQKHMFERLFRASNVTNIQGTGLGLNIVKKYIDLHNGSIDFTSQPDQGSTFTVNIPQK